MKDCDQCQGWNEGRQAKFSYLAITWVRHSMPTQLDIHDIGAMAFNSHVNIAVCIIHQAVIPVFIVPRVKFFVIELAQRPRWYVSSY